MIRSMLRWLATLVLLVLLAAGAAYLIAGRGAPPRLTIDKPEKLVGQQSALEVSAEAPGARFTSLTIAVEQNGKSVPLFTLLGGPTANITQLDRNRLHISRPFGKQAVPELQPGAAQIVVSATRPSFLNLRTLSSRITKEVQVRLEPPRVAVVSTHHYVNHGGSEMIVYRASPPDARSGVRVGDVEYPGYPASGAGVADPALKVAFFALLHDQDLNAPIAGFAQDEATFADHRTYFYKGQEVDQQVHLGFDLAVTSNVAVVAANAGTVLNASWLGIYGNCIIIDHGMGVASLYGHLSSFDVKVGDTVTKGQTIGRSGMTGLAGGDHLHFTMLVSGHPVNPVEWWDAHWVQDRVDRKLGEAGGGTSTAGR